MIRKLKAEEKALLRTAIKLAKDGDTAILRYLLKQVMPITPVDIPESGIRSPQHAYKLLLRGKLSPKTAEDLFRAIKAYLEIQDVRALESRIAELEKRIKR